MSVLLNSKVNVSFDERGLRRGTRNSNVHQYHREEHHSPRVFNEPQQRNQDDSDYEDESGKKAAEAVKKLISMPLQLNMKRS